MENILYFGWEQPQVVQDRETLAHFDGVFTAVMAFVDLNTCFYDNLTFSGRKENCWEAFFLFALMGMLNW